jgi:uncharacterized membrane protein YkoI
MKLLVQTIILSSTLASVMAADVRLADCPAAVRATIQENQRDGRVDEVEMYQIEGKSLYVAEVDLPNHRDLKIHVRADGSLLKTREDSALAEVPEAVRQAASARLGGGTVDDVDKETVGKTVTYHIEVDRKGAADVDLVIAEDGKILSETEDYDD